jgi:hypothetical protein
MANLPLARSGATSAIALATGRYERLRLNRRGDILRADAPPMRPTIMISLVGVEPEIRVGDVAKTLEKRAGERDQHDADRRLQSEQRTA